MNDPIKTQWFSTQEAVFNCLSLMIKDGWKVSSVGTGLICGDLVARPVKKVGSNIFTGVFLWKIKKEK